MQFESFRHECRVGRIRAVVGNLVKRQVCWNIGSMQILNTLFPVFAVILLGWLLCRFQFADRVLFGQLNRLVYWVGLPCLLFLKTAQSTIQLAEAGRVFLVLSAGMLGCLAVGYVTARLAAVPTCNLGVYLQGAYRGNLAYLGLPLILFALAGADAAALPELEAVAVIAIAPLVPIYNAVAVLCLLHDRHCAADGGGDGIPWARIAFGTATNPLILACLAGIAWAFLGRPLPTAAARMLGTVGGMALPLALLGLGASLSFQSVRGRFAPVLGSSLVKLVASPVIGVIVGRFMGLTPHELMIAVIYLACPAAITSYVMAHQMRADHDLAGAVVVVSTVLAFPVLTIVLWMF